VPSPKSAACSWIVASLPKEDIGKKKKYHFVKKVFGLESDVASEVDELNIRNPGVDYVYYKA
jgi:hypothetical protein